MSVEECLARAHLRSNDFREELIWRLKWVNPKSNVIHRLNIGFEMSA
jgi:hypothetical protein